MTINGRIQALQDRHDKLDENISHEEGRPAPDENLLVKMKMEKLRLKDEIEQLRRQMH
ncbi:hypothetical protein JGUZn3_13460 [Entomobacter blattae]|uniref:DUF465 domain-containing protein n=2 Tax=Entomobacter blattae TaxID=2762277 RepID=A0A7H1NS12_9PROT|nr:DUF465 domain-containing protein [Entomobacter blattae]QNT78572.1 hypothetical protein JGUZn3_13460 [Entomobacter blattae]